MEDVKHELCRHSRYDKRSGNCTTDAQRGHSSNYYISIRWTHRPGVWLLAVSPDGRAIASGGGNDHHQEQGESIRSSRDRGFGLSCARVMTMRSTSVTVIISDCGYKQMIIETWRLMAKLTAPLTTQDRSNDRWYILIHALTMIIQEIRDLICSDRYKFDAGNFWLI